MLIALAISAVAVWLGKWQYGRYVDRAEALADYETAVEMPPISVGELVPVGASSLPEGAEWRTVTATGHFDEKSLTILRTRPVEGTPAWQFLAWLNTDDDRSFLVSLGWIRQPGPNEEPVIPHLDPTEQVTVTAVLRTWEPDDGKGAGGTVSRIAPEQLATPAHDPVAGYGMLREWCGPQGCHYDGGEQVPLPNLSTGPHLSYAWQWWLFAVMAPVGGILLLRRDARMAADVGGESATHPASPPATPATTQDVALPRSSFGSRTRQRELSDEEIEDAL